MRHRATETQRIFSFSPCLCASVAHGSVPRRPCRLSPRPASARIRPMLRMSLPALAACLTFFAADSRAQTIDAGKTQFQARCVSCHGEDGTGGARGITIVDLRQPRATSKDAVRDLIRTGIPNEGMPAFPIADNELESIAAYV